MCYNAVRTGCSGRGSACGKGSIKRWEFFEKVSDYSFVKQHAADRVRNEEILHSVKEERNILHKLKIRKVKLIGHMLRRNCLLKHVIEGKLEDRSEMTGSRGRKYKYLLDDVKEKKKILENEI
jgi:hypothetical protein